jgi:hypothetical protein
MTSPVWVTWKSPYTKGTTSVAHRVRGTFNTDIQLRTKCGQRFAGQCAVVADPNIPRCKRCTP